MKQVLLPVILVATLASVSIARAGTLDGAVVGLHAQAHPEKGSGSHCAWDGTSCGDWVTAWPAFTIADVYLVVAHGDPGAGVGALSCGIDYGENLGVSGWTFCASGLEFPNDGGKGEWPADDGGMRLTWNAVVDCQRTVVEPFGVHAVAGSFTVYAYGPDRLSVTPNRNLVSGPELVVADCLNSLSDLPEEAAGAVGFGGSPGRSPCLGEPVRSVTWGALKRGYSR